MLVWRPGEDSVTCLRHRGDNGLNSTQNGRVWENLKWSVLFGDKLGRTYISIAVIEAKSQPARSDPILDDIRLRLSPRHWNNFRIVFPGFLGEDGCDKKSHICRSIKLATSFPEIVILPLIECAMGPQTECTVSCPSIEFAIFP
jgi:hypothetical protein